MRQDHCPRSEKARVYIIRGWPILVVQSTVMWAYHTMSGQQKYGMALMFVLDRSTVDFPTMMTYDIYVIFPRSPLVPAPLRVLFITPFPLLPCSVRHDSAFAFLFSERYTRGRERSESRSPTRERKRRRSRSPSTPPRPRETPDRQKDKSKNEDDEGENKKETNKEKAGVVKAKKPKGSKLFKQIKKDEDEVDGGDKEGKAAAGSVEYWNDERAKLGLKPLK